MAKITDETKAEARALARKEFDRENPGMRYKKKISKDRKKRHDRVANCLVCGRISDLCICSGSMTTAAQDRFFKKRKEDEMRAIDRGDFRPP